MNQATREELEEYQTMLIAMRGRERDALRTTTAAIKSIMNALRED